MKYVIIYGDSQLVIRHMNVKYKCNTVTLWDFYQSTKKLLQYFANVIIEHVYRDENDEVNELAQHASGYKKIKGETMDHFVEDLAIRTTRECYMASLKLSPLTKDEPCQVVHYVEIIVGVEGSEELELDLRTNDDNRVKPIEETCNFQLDIKEE